MTDERHTHHSLRSEGPSVVAIGGGHGLSATLRALRHYAGDITAVVSVADDGGSTGRLRAAMPDLPAPGDVRKCLGALASEDEPFALLLEHRFDNGELAGHTLGNLLLVALAGELGSFDGAVAELAQRVGAVGRVLPATEVPVSLEAVTASAATPIVGQVAVQNTAGVRQIRLQPPNPPTSAEVVEAILSADQVVLGPGSLFTSVLAAAVVPAVRDAMASTQARRIYVANLGPQVPETEGFSFVDELEALRAHGITVEEVLVDEERSDGGVDQAVSHLDTAVESELGCEIHRAALRVEGGSVHDPQRLGGALSVVAHRRVEQL
ncbi:MAG: uridine diphosphate-N-acetylglucosamine-binding protein YvcK [Acidimicrobiales bacterium]|nr:uridine diphosphate-N-acetylglucosamine-binding protein YvcK [Acidimicrobiales bacterium]